MLTAKLAIDLLTSQELEKLPGIPTMLPFILLFVPLIVINITKPKGYSLFLQASLEYAIFSLLNDMVPLPLRASAMAPVRSKARVQKGSLKWFQVPARKATSPKTPQSMVVIAIHTLQKIFLSHG